MAHLIGKERVEVPKTGQIGKEETQNTQTRTDKITETEKLIAVVLMVGQNAQKRAEETILKLTTALNMALSTAVRKTPMTKKMTGTKNTILASKMSTAIRKSEPDEVE